MEDKDILFRGKQLYANTWVTGYHIVRPNGRHEIYDPKASCACGGIKGLFHGVDPDSIERIVSDVQK